MVGQLHTRVVQLAVEKRVIQGPRMRVDTLWWRLTFTTPPTAVCWAEGARLLTRLSKRIAKAVGGLKSKVRDRMRTVKRKVVAIAIAARQKGAAREEKRNKIYHPTRRPRADLHHIRPNAPDHLLAKRNFLLACSGLF